MPTVQAEPSLFRVAFGTEGDGMFDSGLPVLTGPATETFFGATRPAGRTGSVALFEAGHWLLGAVSLPVDPGLEAVARRVYQDILQASRGRHLARIWNYVPAINELSPEGLENYQIFCRGRSLAFEQAHGRAFKALLPAASAVGTKTRTLTVAFAATPVSPRHVENPLQVPAYDYPGTYGPRAPSFARATVVPGKDGATVFISGTAAIRGHASVAPDNVRQQLDCALENLAEISRACRLGLKLDQGGRSSRHFKVYVRHAAHFPIVAAILQERLLSRADQVTYLVADICRSSLLVEIEASLVNAIIRPA